MDLFRKKTASQLISASKNSLLKKNLTAVDLAALGIGSVVGTGIFVATGQGAQMAGPGIIISFIVAAITCGFCALTYSELATMFPVAGSTYSYCYAAFGEMIAWIIGWDLMLEYLVVAGAIASGWSGTFVGLLHTAGINLPVAFVNTRIADPRGIMDLPAILITLFVTCVLYVGIKESTKMNNVIVLFKIAVIILFVVLGIGHVNFANLQPLLPYGWHGVMGGAAIIFFAYIGFDAVSTAAEETIDPKRDVPKGIVVCLITVIILYILVAFVLTGMVPYKQISVNNALPAALASIGINWGSALVAVGAIVGMISTLLVTVYGQIRIFMVMSRDGLLPPAFSKVHPVHKTPYICTWITGILTAAIGGFVPLPMIIDLCNIGTLFAFVLVSIGVIVLRRTMPDIDRPFKCPGVPFTPILTVVFCVYLMCALPIVTWVRFIVWLILGGLIYFGYGAKHSALNKIKDKDTNLTI